MKKLDTILLVDDDAPTNFFNKLIIKKIDCAEKVDVTLNGLDALQYLKNMYQLNKCQPDLILLDINMPSMNGWEFLEEYSKLDFIHKKSSAIIIMLTTSLNPCDMEKANAIKAISGFAHKPFTTDNLSLIITKHFMEKEKQLI